MSKDQPSSDNKLGDGNTTPGSATTAGGTHMPSGGVATTPGSIEQLEGWTETPSVAGLGIGELVSLGTALIGSGTPAVIKALTDNPEVAFSVNPIGWDGGDGHSQPAKFFVNIVSQVDTQAYLMRVEVKSQSSVSVYGVDTSASLSKSPDRQLTGPLALKRGKGEKTQIRIDCRNAQEKPRWFDVVYHILLLSHSESLRITSNLAVPTNY